jgi:translation initiation factor 1
MKTLARSSRVSRTTFIFVSNVCSASPRKFPRDAAPLALLVGFICKPYHTPPSLVLSPHARDTHFISNLHRLLISLTERNGRKTLTTVQGLPKKFDQKKILKVIKKKFACNGTIVTDAEMGEVVQLQGDQRKDVQDFLTDKKEGLGLDAKTIKVSPDVDFASSNECGANAGIQVHGF